MKNQVAVVFLARGIGGGVAAMSAFLESYDRHPAGAPHQLIVLRKGFNEATEAAKIAEMAQGRSAHVLDLPDDGFDWGAYFRAAQIVPNATLLLLNTHSRILADQWLARMLAAGETPSCGAVGATASWQTAAPTLRFAAPLALWVASNRTVVHGVAEAIQQYGGVALGRLHPRGRDYHGFPNPHLRSNALLIRRELLLEFAAQHRMPDDKEAAFRLESGRRGLTRFLVAKRLTPLVAGVEGSAFGSEAWDSAGVFRVPGQRNLIIGDNQTRMYDMASERQRHFLELLTWGRRIPQ